MVNKVSKILLTALLGIYFLTYVDVIGYAQVENIKITESEIKVHLEFLTSAKNKGRYPGTKGNKRVVKYIRSEFGNYGLQAFEGDYLQEFEAELRVRKGESPKSPVKTWNVIGYVEGTDPILKDEYIVVGAHYDHLGHGGPSSKKPESDEIHPGADDNASGTSALLEIAHKMAGNRFMLSRSVIFVAFGAEEQGLLGSKHFVEHLPVPKESVKLMINMDMVGRLNANKQVYMGGAGTFPGGVDLMKDLGLELGLNPVVNAGEVGGSDHVSFYKAGISAMGLHTGGHPEYHRPEDTADLINIEGERVIAEYVYRTIVKVAQGNYHLEFINQD
ncbi:M20/M25/M40 family metallo-hydrolase [Echinicola marina]|uniref:M20/M25/M40 family metallo-hydrolase n=1 Tax=Echinicola marina TaxID=2859768 RepID=UPI001CF6686B|nr:M20/M25/M40 family metallo-hydrolase [Echinicola marina]UCS95233.1 M20/M25/M40 family metallo-hydrolase [Echinicola marina]